MIFIIQCEAAFLLEMYFVHVQKLHYGAVSLDIFRQSFEVCLSESKRSFERCVQPRRAVSLWSGDHNDSLKYDNLACNQKGNMAHYVKSIWFWCKMLFCIALYIKRAEPTLSARGIVC